MTFDKVEISNSFTVEGSKLIFRKIPLVIWEGSYANAIDLDSWEPRLFYDDDEVIGLTDGD